MAEKRFIQSYAKGVYTGQKIIVDTETGINYLFMKDGYAGGLTPLLDKDGKPIVTPVD